jgi:hypothetical protein
MDLVERYIEAVKFWLPKKLKEDVAAELTEDIRSQIEEAEQEKGRKLSEDEVAAVLKARGNPLYVASRYLPQHTLIGPELYPLYIFVLKIVAAICFIPPLLGTFLFDSDARLPNAFASPTYSLLVSFAIVTIIFAVIERRGLNPAKSQNWNPKSLRPVADRNRIKRSTSVGDIIGCLIGIGFFLAGYLSITTYPLVPGLIFADGHISAIGLSRGHVTVSPEWVPYWQFIMVIAIVEIAFAAANLFKPYWTLSRALLRMVLDLVKIAALCWLLQSHLLREFVVQGVSPDGAAGLFRLSDLAAQYALPFAGVMGFTIVITAIWRMVRQGYPKLSPA